MVDYDNATIATVVNTAIERHKAARAALALAVAATDQVASRQNGREVTPDDEASLVKADAAEVAALDALSETVPARGADISALLTYFVAIGQIEGSLVAGLLESPLLATA